MNIRSCFELFEMFFEVKNLQTNNSKQLLNVERIDRSGATQGVWGIQSSVPPPGAVT